MSRTGRAECSPVSEIRNPWFTEVERNVQEVSITHQEIRDHEPLKRKENLQHIRISRKNEFKGLAKCGPENELKNTDIDSWDARKRKQLS